MSHEFLYERLKFLRKEKKLYLKDVGSAVGISSGYLSQIETGKVEPTISTLRKLASFYNVSIVYFFETEINQEIVVRYNDRKQLWHDNKSLIYESLQGSIKGKSMQAIYVRILPGTDSFFSSHPGEEFMIIMKGLLRFTYESVVYDLHPGDCIYYDASKKLSFSNPLKQEIEVLAVCSPPVL